MDNGNTNRSINTLSNWWRWSGDRSSTNSTNMKSTNQMKWTKRPTRNNTTSSTNVNDLSTITTKTRYKPTSSDRSSLSTVSSSAISTSSSSYSTNSFSTDTKFNIGKQETQETRHDKSLFSTNTNRIQRRSTNARGKKKVAEKSSISSSSAMSSSSSMSIPYEASWGSSKRGLGINSRENRRLTIGGTNAHHQLQSSIISTQTISSRHYKSKQNISRSSRTSRYEDTRSSKYEDTKYHVSRFSKYEDTKYHVSRSSQKEDIKYNIPKSSPDEDMKEDTKYNISCQSSDIYFPSSQDLDLAFAARAMLKHCVHSRYKRTVDGTAKSSIPFQEFGFPTKNDINNKAKGNWGGISTVSSSSDEDLKQLRTDQWHTMDSDHDMHESLSSSSDIDPSYLNTIYDDMQEKGVPVEIRYQLPLALGTAKETSKECSICQLYYNIGDHILMLPCQHYFHACCVDKWLWSRTSCPLCRSEVSLDTMQKSLSITNNEFTKCTEQEQDIVHRKLTSSANAALFRPLALEVENLGDSLLNMMMESENEQEEQERRCYRLIPQWQNPT